MNEAERYPGVSEVLDDDPVKIENLRLRSELMRAIGEKIRSEGINQTEAAKRLRITQPRVSALLKGKIDAFRLDSLVNMAHRLGLQVSLKVAA